MVGFSRSVRQLSKVERPHDELPQSYDRPMLALPTNAVSEGDGGLRRFCEFVLGTEAWFVMKRDGPCHCNAATSCDGPGM